MNKKFIALTMVLVLAMGLLAACGKTDTTDGNTSDDTSDKLVVYSPNSEDIINLVIPAFEKETGIKVELISAGTGELMKRIESEKENPYADVIFGIAEAQFAQNPDLYQEYVSPNDEYMLEGHKSKHGYLTPYNSDGSCLLVNTDLIGDIKIEGYEDLLNPELKGKIAYPDPASSSSAFNQLTNMLVAMGGDYESQEGWDYVGKLIENLDGKVSGGSGAAHKSVADGEYVVALTYEDPSVSYVRDGAPVKVVYPKEGTIYGDAHLAIIKGAKNLENAKKFIDFVTSKEIQDAFGTEIFIRPLRADAELSDSMTPLENISTLEENIEYVTEHKNEIVERYIDLFTSLQK